MRERVKYFMNTFLFLKGPLIVTPIVLWRIAASQIVLYRATILTRRRSRFVLYQHAKAEGRNLLPFGQESQPISTGVLNRNCVYPSKETLSLGRLQGEFKLVTIAV